MYPNSYSNPKNLNGLLPNANRWTNKSETPCRVKLMKHSRDEKSATNHRWYPTAQTYLCTLAQLGQSDRPRIRRDARTRHGSVRVGDLRAQRRPMYRQSTALQGRRRSGIYWPRKRRAAVCSATTDLCGLWRPSDRGLVTCTGTIRIFESWFTCVLELVWDYEPTTQLY